MHYYYIPIYITATGTIQAIKTETSEKCGEDATQSFNIELAVPLGTTVVELLVVNANCITVKNYIHVNWQIFTESKEI